jgi:uncharacterized lipoprotein YbaY
MNTQRQLVSGIILLPHDAPAAHQVPIYVRLLETSYADAPARVIASQRLDAANVAGGTSHPFELRMDRVDPKAHYTVDAHVDVDRDGHAGPGDYITMVSHPVLTFGRPDWVLLEVRRIG